jgi:hypothetical protein
MDTRCALGLCLGLALAAAAAPLFEDDFADPALAPGWELEASAGSAVELRDGRLAVRAKLNTFAHAQRPVGADNVTATTLMQPSVPSGVSWACGLWLYWSPGAWIQLAISDFQGGQYYVAEASVGAPREAYLKICDRTRPHWLRLELGQDVVRYQTRTAETEEWTLQRAMKRLPEWQGPPQLLVLGKGYGRGEGEYGQPDLDNDYPPDAGPVVESWFERVTVEPTAADRLQALPGEIPPRGDADGERLLALPGDPTYEAVAALYPPMRHVREAVGVRWHRDEIGVGETGALELRSPADRDAGMSLAGILHVGPAGAAFGSGPTRPVKRLLDGWLPVVLATWTHGGVTHEQTVFGYSASLSDREPLYAYVRLTARGPAGRLPVSFRVTPEGAGCAPLAGELTVSAEGVGAWACRVPATVKPGEKVEPLPLAEFEAALEATRSFWQADLRQGLQIDVPDPRLMDAHRAWLAYNAIDVDRVGEVYEAHDGSGFYEEGYGYSAARYAWVLDLYGRHDEAAAILAGLRHQQRPDGSLDWNFGLTDTGAYLLAVVAHYTLSGDAEWLRSLAPSLTAACDYLARRRPESREAGPLVAGLIKHRSYCDYPPPVYGYLHNGYCCAGMEQTAAALRAVGQDADAERIGAEAARYRQDLERSMQAAIITRDGRRILPLEPDTQRLLKDAGYDSRDYYTLVASMLLECGFLAPDSPEADLLASFLREAGGIQVGVCEFRGGIDHAYGYGYLEHCLRRGDAERYLLGLYASLAYGMTRETYSSVECTQHKTGENAMTLPHLYSGTQQLFLLRMLLLREEAGKLVLCSAVRRAWLEGGRHLEVTGAATSWGEVSFRLESQPDARRLAATVSRPSRSLPQAVELWLRQPQGKAIRSVTVNGRPWTRFAAEAVHIAPGELPCRVDAEFEP